jgi:hypothetical protein
MEENNAPKTLTMPVTLPTITSLLKQQQAG